MATQPPSTGGQRPALCPCLPTAVGICRAVLTLQQAQALSWPALEMKILASLACDENTKTSLPPFSYRSGIDKAKDIWRRKGKALPVMAVPIFLFPWYTATHRAMYLQFPGSDQHCWQLSAHPNNARTSQECSQTQFSLAAPTGSESGLNGVRLQPETPRCVPATACSLASVDWCLTAEIMFLSSTYS